MITGRGLTKRYGPTTALDGVDLDVPAGTVYGLVGPNGAGKTTLLGLLSGLRQPTAGSFEIGVPTDQVAVLPDTPQFDSWLTGREVVSLACRLVGGETERVETVLADAGLADAADRPVGGYSRGMLQRLGIACTVVGSPRVVLLDEPASALDPLGRREVLDLVSRLRGDATVLFSSHILGDVQEVCDTVGVLHHGRLLFQGAIDALLVGSAVPRYVIRCRGETGVAQEALGAQPWVVDVELNGAEELVVSVATVEDAERRLTGVLAASGVRVVSFAPESVSLERAFLELTS